MGNCLQKDAIPHGAQPISEGNVQKIGNRSQWEQKMSEASKEGKNVIVNFSASWCGPCRAISPFYAELSTKYPSFIFLVIDVDELSSFCSSWDIQTTPTFFFLKNEVQVDKFIGSDKEELENKVRMLAN